MLGFTLLNKFTIGHVYKVKGNWRPDDIGREDYYCTIIKHPRTGELVTYIPNCFTRKLSNYCQLKDRMSYVGSFEKYGHLLFDQHYLKNQGDPYSHNEFNTKIVYIPKMKFDANTISETSTEVQF